MTSSAVRARQLQLLGQQVVAGDGHLLVLGVTVEGDDLHTVEQRPRDGLQDVGRREEEHVRQVELDLQVVVAEGVVLRGVEDLEQGGRRVAPVVGADLVDLVEQHDRVHRARLADRPDDATGLRADVGAPVSADLRLVAHAAEGDADELPAHGARHGLTQRRLADSRRARQSEDGAAAAAAHHAEALVLAALAHGQVLDDAVLHVVEAGVVGVEHLTGARDVVVVVARLVPRDVEDGVEPRADPAGLGRLVGGPLQLVDLLERGLTHLLGEVGRLHTGAVVLLLGLGVAVELLELLADRGKLLAQQELPLLLLHALLDVLADRLGHVQLGQVLTRPLDQLGQPVGGVGGLQQLHLLRGAQPRGVAGAVGQHGGIVDLVDLVDHLPRAALLQDGRGQGLVLLGQFLRPLTDLDGVDREHLHPQGRARACRALADPGPVDATDDGGGLTPGEPSDLLHHGLDADGAVSAVDPGNEEHPRLVETRSLSRVDRSPDLGVGQVQRDHHARQDHLVVEWQDREDQALTHLNSKGLSYTDSINESPPMFPKLLMFAHSDRNDVSDTSEGSLSGVMRAWSEARRLLR
ncbi:hypothetical protein FHR33_008446 [Nonomuraea dietziae]|uniref:Uncharacterized protein n=1 Tax=Nonomuraea dietziae TaxID=65515 RepID=A0A7W5V8K6_9ACTN|nr:hypothetical protein [Nonomuraea dietziae]